MMKPITGAEPPRNLSEYDDRTREVLAEMANQTVELTEIELADATMCFLAVQLNGSSYGIKTSVRDRRRLGKLYVKAVERLMALVTREGCPEYSWKRPLALEEPMTKPSTETEDWRVREMPSPKRPADWQALAREFIWDMTGTLPTHADIAQCVPSMIQKVLEGEAFSNKRTLQHKLELGKLYLQALDHHTAVKASPASKHPASFFASEGLSQNDRSHDDKLMFDLAPPRPR